jgi:hypothetical protein
MREVMFSFSPTVSSRRRSSGNSGVRSSKRRRDFDSSGSRPQIESMRSSAGYFSLFALSQREPPRLADRDVDVLRRGQVALRANEPVALVAQVEEPAHLDELTGVGLLLGSLEVAVASLAVTAAASPVVPAVRRVVRRRRRTGAALGARTSWGVGRLLGDRGGFCGRLGGRGRGHHAHELHLEVIGDLIVRGTVRAR